MKNQLLTLALVICALFSFTSSVDAQNKEGGMQFDLYHAVPPHQGIIFRAVSTVSDGETVDVSVLGNLGLRFQYYVKPKFALGLDLNYTKRTADLTYVGGITGLSYTDAIQQTIIRAMIRTSWEFVDSEKFHMNWANSIGYRTADWTFSSTDPLFIPDADWTGGGFPAFRTAIGMRVMFTENVGLNLEIGVGGGSVANGGLTIAL